MFYWLTESRGRPKTDPLILWLNGGPGCSSLEGLFAENGPFTPVNYGRSLLLDPYGWVNKVQILEASFFFVN